MINFSKLAVILTAGVVFCGCVKNNIPENPDSKPVNMFDYATAQDCMLDLNYNLPKGYDIVFSIYTEDPFGENGERKENISSAFKAMTTDGKFNSVTAGTILRLPSYVEQIYICSDNIGVESKIVVPVTNNTIKMDTKTIATAVKSAFSTKASSGVVGGDLKSLGTWNENGIPDYLMSPVALSSELLKDVDYCFNKTKHKVTEAFPQFFATDAVLDANIIKATALEITYIRTTAALKSALAYFTYPTGQKPSAIENIKSRIVAIPCTVDKLQTGDRIKLKYWNGTTFLDEFPAGVSVGWVLLSNAYKGDNSVQEEKHMTQYSNSNLNREGNQALKQHVIQLYSAREKGYFIAFEDQSREGEKANSDFADCHILLRSPIEGAIDNTGVADIVEWKDSDGDGVHDNEDEFPNDPDVAFTIHYPAGAEYGTLAFEDLWPSKGDYDLNDLIVTYRSTHFVNKNSFIARVKDEFSIIHTGAGMRNGFGYQYNYINANKIKSVTKMSDYSEGDMLPFVFDNKGLEANQNFPTIILCKDVNAALIGREKVDFTVEVVFSSAQKPYIKGKNDDGLLLPPYNPFMIIQSGEGKRDKEVHLPRFQPTSLVDFSLFGKYDDKSDIAQNLFYVSSELFPFALNISDKFNYPAEKQRIDQAYPSFNAWVESGGAEHKDWYKK